MRNKSIIIEEIVELSEIKSAYNHYLSSPKPLTEVENTTQIQKNREVISESITQLYGLLAKEKPETGKGTGTTHPGPLHHSPNERNAILHFNRDRRFSITE